MNGTTKLKSLGIIELDGVSVNGGQIEVHIPISEVSEQLEKVLDECAKLYVQKYDKVTVEDLNFDVRVVLSCGNFCRGDEKETEFDLFVVVWQQNDDETGKDTAEFYEEIPVLFSAEETRRIKKIVWDSLGEMLFNL